MLRGTYLSRTNTYEMPIFTNVKTRNASNN